MVGCRPRAHHSSRAMPGIAAVMQDDKEFVILNRLHDIAYIVRGKLAAVFVREQSRSWLRHHHATHSRQFQGLTILLDEHRTLAKQLMSSIGAFIDKHHQLRHVIQTTCQRERPYAAGKDGTVGDVAGCQEVGLQIGWYAPS